MLETIYNNRMDIHSILANKAKPIEIEPSETSYFSVPGAGLDPRLFRDGKLIPAVRSSIFRILLEHLKANYNSPEAYIQVWLAGSAVSYQWSAARKPADLDCLIGINYPIFRQANAQYRGLSDKEISAMINENLRSQVHPNTSNFLENYELTFYANVLSDIRSIKPYAAYSLTNDDWTVQPSINKLPNNKAWEQRVQRDTSFTVEILERYTTALNDIGAARTDMARRNAEAALKLAVEQGAALFEDIHKGRSSAFSPGGLGYTDVANYRWQAGKASGTVQALKKLKDISSESKKEFETKTYGMQLPDASTLIRRAASARLQSN